MEAKLIDRNQFLDVTKHDLDKMGIPAGHQLKILGYISEVKKALDGKSGKKEDSKTKPEAPVIKHEITIQKEDEEE